MPPLGAARERCLAGSTVVRASEFLSGFCAFLPVGVRYPCLLVMGGGVTVLMGRSLLATALVNPPLRDAAMGMALWWLLGVSLVAQGAPRNA